MLLRRGSQAGSLAAQVFNATRLCSSGASVRGIRPGLGAGGCESGRACVSGEIFSRSADDLRARTSPCSYIAGYSNGNLGYIPIPEVYAEGGYEVKDAHRYYAHFALAPEAYGRVVDCAADLVAGLNATPTPR